MKNIFLSSNNRLRSIWWIPIFLLFLMLFLFPSILAAEHYDVELPIPIQAILIILATSICQMLRKEPLTQITGKLNKTWIIQFSKGLLLGSVLMILPAIILTIFGFAQWQVYNMSITTILSGLVIFTGVAIAEEFLFRGFLFQRLIESLGQWPAQVIISCMFVLTHLNNPGMVGTTKAIASLNIFIASIMFGLAYINTKSIAMPLGLHFMANFMQGTILGFGVSGEKEPSLFKVSTDNSPAWLSGGEFGLEASLLGLITVTAISVILYRKKSKLV